MAITLEDKSCKDFLVQVSKLEPSEFIGLAKVLGIEMVEKDVDCGQPVEVKDEGEGNSPDRPGYHVRAAEDILVSMVEKYISLERKGRRNVMKLVKTATKKK